LTVFNASGAIRKLLRMNRLEGFFAVTGLGRASVQSIQWNAAG